VLPADVVKSISGQVTFEIVPGCAVPKAEASRLMNWALESLRHQAVATKAAGLPAAGMRTAPRMKR
ncbi:hypothetical protein, partial [Paucibacter soli]|uniref:hypothetical protein n=1 Tax=Paucibacter soli TaxID=3133433 RepID=UPI00309E0AC7